jgi:hypothetical protein
MSFRPVKPREYATTKAVVGAMYAQAGGAKRVADLIDRSTTVTYSYADPGEPAEITFDLLRKIARFHRQATAAAEDLAALAGGTFLPCPIPNASFDAITAETAEEWGAFMAALIRAHAGEDLHGHRERHPQLRERLDHLLHALGSARAALIALEQKK